MPIPHKTFGIILLNSHFFFSPPPLFHPLWTSTATKCLNGCICSLPLLHNVMNVKWFLFNLALHNVWYFAENLEGEQALSPEGERQRLIWNSLCHSLHEKKKNNPAIQQVIRNAKKTRGKSQRQRHLGTSICSSICSVCTCLHGK